MRYNKCCVRLNAQRKLITCLYRIINMKLISFASNILSLSMKSQAQNTSSFLWLRFAKKLLQCKLLYIQFLTHLDSVPWYMIFSVLANTILQTQGRFAVSLISFNLLQKRQRRQLKYLCFSHIFTRHPWLPAEFFYFSLGFLLFYLIFYDLNRTRHPKRRQ